MDRDAKARRGDLPIAFTSLVAAGRRRRRRRLGARAAGQLALGRSASDATDGSMDASTEIEVGLDARGHTVLRRMRCEAPLLVRVADEPGPASPCRSSTARPARWAATACGSGWTSVTGAHVVVRSVAAAMAQPGPHGRSSTSTSISCVGDDATLDWAPSRWSAWSAATTAPRSRLSAIRHVDGHLRRGGLARTSWRTVRSAWRSASV